jgi:alpha-glucosidase
VFNITAIMMTRWSRSLPIALAFSCYAGALAQSSSSSPAAASVYQPTKTATQLTTTVSGATSTYSVAFTVPVSADVGANVLPNIKDPKAKIAQQLCPGYIAKNVSHTAYGFKAILELAGPAVSTKKLSS